MQTSVTLARLCPGPSIFGASLGNPLQGLGSATVSAVPGARVSMSAPMQVLPGTITVTISLMDRQDNKDHTLKSWETVADVTEKVLGRCVDATQVKGRLSSSDGWGVIVQKAAC